MSNRPVCDDFTHSLLRRQVFLLISVHEENNTHHPTLLDKQVATD
jgi:hypothetical protein